MNRRQFIGASAGLAVAGLALPVIATAPKRPDAALIAKRLYGLLGTVWDGATTLLFVGAEGDVLSDKIVVRVFCSVVDPSQFSTVPSNRSNWTHAFADIKDAGGEIHLMTWVPDAPHSAETIWGRGQKVLPAN